MSTHRSVRQIAGIDVSTKAIAVVVLSASDGSLLRWEQFDYPKLNDLPERNVTHRCRWITLDDYASFMRGVHVAQIEQPMGAHAKSVAEVERVVGAVIRSTPSKTDVAVLLGPSEWKKAAGLPGNASKVQIAAYALQLYPLLQGESQDILDASLIGRAYYNIFSKD